jgi:hypothetical protein
VTAYPVTPEGWTVLERRSAGPFVTDVRYARADGSTTHWSSRAHRKHSSRLSRVRLLHDSVWWAPYRASWWVAVLFVLGSACFVVAPIPWFAEHVGASADGMVFFIGSLLFTTAATLQWLETINSDRGPASSGEGSTRVVAWEPHRIDWWSSGVQLIGTLAFNATTFRALSTTADQSSYDHAVWRPDAVGSVCFLVASYLAYVEVTGGLVRRPVRTLEGNVVTLNLLGSLAFGLAAVASYVVPSSGEMVNVPVVNAGTAIGALCFLVAAALLLPEGARTES